MLRSGEQLHAMTTKRQILVVDDESINREMLGMILEDQYEVFFAENGEEAMREIRARKETLSLVLLDILMPVMSGREVLKEMGADKELSRVPVIVLTADQEAEVECLNMGAADFIPKPYPAADVVKARVLRTIELSEDRETIKFTERDELTGLYNLEFFYRYVRQYDQHNKDTPTDAIILDINHFHMINERYGKAYGDEILKRIAKNAQQCVRPSGGMVCRRSADTFMVYCKHREDYNELLAEITEGVSGDDSGENRVRLRMGVYPNTDRQLDIEQRFDRAKMAADTIQGSFAKVVALYDSAMHEKELYTEQLIEDFNKAVREKQFIVYYQPKFDIRGEKPVLCSAEALVRWAHPTLGMVSPGVFIPLFEGNGLIREMDRYIWRESCRQMREWQDRFGIHVPVSVNVSRIDLYDPDLLEIIPKYAEEFGLTGRDLLLEVTESAYTQDSAQIIEVVEKLRAIGFRIELDDFGTGYSSLNMISSLPFDVLKLDMQFIRSAFREGGDTRMLELIVDIADYLDVPVIAEGVETEEQVEALKLMGCDLVQGFYFSRPIPAAEFETFLKKRKEELYEEQAEGPSEEKKARLMEEGRWKETSVRPAEESAAVPADGSGAPESGSDPGEKAENIDPETDAAESALAGTEPEEPETETEITAGELPEQASDGHHSAPQLRTATFFFAVIAVIAAAALFLADTAVSRGYQRMEQASDRYIAAQLAASDMESGSDYLTDRVRCFVVTGEIHYLTDFFREVEETRRRDKAVHNLEGLLEGRDDAALASLNTALNYSNELVGIEYYAMRLKLETGNFDDADIPEQIASIELQEADKGLTDVELSNKAQMLVFDNNYMHNKSLIRENVSICTQALIRASSQELERASAQMSLLVSIQTAMTVVFLVIVLFLVMFINEMIRKPLTNMVLLMRDQKEIPPTGAEELQFVTRTYNSILEENRTAHERLSHEASHDALTGLLNRGAYDMLMQSMDTEHIALLIVDVDHFKSVNDNYGHAVGDRVLKRVAEILKHSFRSVDLICRIGGDEFVVVMTRVNSSMRTMVQNKIFKANELLLHPKDDLPPVSLSVGAAFSDRENPQGDIFKDADTALYRVKEAGRNGCIIY